MIEKRARRTIHEDQKKHLFALFNHAKARSEIIREYDLTAMRVGTRWAYVGILLGLGVRETIGQSTGANKTPRW